MAYNYDFEDFDVGDPPRKDGYGQQQSFASNGKPSRLAEFLEKADNMELLGPQGKPKHSNSKADNTNTSKSKTLFPDDRARDGIDELISGGKKGAAHVAPATSKAAAKANTRSAKRSGGVSTRGAAKKSTSKQSSIRDLMSSEQQKPATKQHRPRVPHDKVSVVAERAFDEIARLNNVIEEMQVEKRVYIEENKTLKEMQRRQEKAIQKLDVEYANVPATIDKLNEEIKSLRKQSVQYREKMALNDKLSKSLHDEMVKYRSQVEKMTVILRSRNLEDNDKLSSQVMRLKSELAERDELVQELEKNIQLLRKEHEREIRESRQLRGKTSNEHDEFRKAYEDLYIKYKEKERQLVHFSVYARQLSKMPSNLQQNMQSMLENHSRVVSNISQKSLDLLSNYNAPSIAVSEAAASKPFVVRQAAPAPVVPIVKDKTAAVPSKIPSLAPPAAVKPAAAAATAPPKPPQAQPPPQKPSSYVEEQISEDFGGYASDHDKPPAPLVSKPAAAKPASIPLETAPKKKQPETNVLKIEPEHLDTPTPPQQQQRTTNKPNFGFLNPADEQPKSKPAGLSATATAITTTTTTTTAKPPLLNLFSGAAAPAAAKPAKKQNQDDGFAYKNPKIGKLQSKLDDLSQKYPDGSEIETYLIMTEKDDLRDQIAHLKEQERTGEYVPPVETPAAAPQPSSNESIAEAVAQYDEPAGFEEPAQPAKPTKASSFLASLATSLSKSKTNLATGAAKPESSKPIFLMDDYKAAPAPAAQAPAPRLLFDDKNADAPAEEEYKPSFLDFGAAEKPARKRGGEKLSFLN